MIKPLNKKIILILVILGLMYYLLKYPIEHLDNPKKNNSKCPLGDSHLALIQILQVKMNDLKDELNKTNSKINTMDGRIQKNTKDLSSLNSQVKDFESKKF